MRIGQLARLIGIDTQTIRFYEQQGLLPPPDRQANGYRVYTEKHSLHPELPNPESVTSRDSRTPTLPG